MWLIFLRNLSILGLCAMILPCYIVSSRLNETSFVPVPNVNLCTDCANLVVVDHVSSILVHAASIIYYGVIFIIFFQRGMMTCRRVFRIANASIFACLPMCYVAALICAGCIHSRYIHSCGGQKKHLWTDNYPAKFRVYLRNASSERPGYRYLEINNPLDSSLFDTPATPTTGTGCSRQIHSRRPVSSWKPRILLTAQIDHDRFASWRGHGHAPGTGRRQCYD